MPVISGFYGIIIRMYFQQSEHNPPHFHALYGDNAAAIEIQTGAILEGDLPKRAMYLIQEWLVLHREELIDMWNSQEFRQLAPLD